MPNRGTDPVKLRTLAFAFQKVSNTVTELYIDDYIVKEKSFDWWTGEEGTEITSRDFIAQLNEVTTPEIVIVMNSGGGEVTEGSAIANAIREKRSEGKKITCKIPALCASAAVDIACACESVSIYRNAYMMIHEARTFLCDMYRAVELRGSANMLDAMNGGVAENYAAKCGKAKEEVLKLMAETTWYSGQEAVDNGFADELLDEAADPVEVKTGPQQRYVMMNGAAVAAADFSKAPAVLQEALKNKGKMGSGNTPQKGDHRMAEIKSIADLKAAYPELCGQMETGAAEAAVKSERARISELDKVADKVPAEMMTEAKYGEKPCDAQAVVYRAVTEGKLVNNVVLGQLAADAKEAGSVPAAANGGPGEGGPQTAEQKKTEAAALAEKASKAR
ncbi:putative prohead protease [Oscillibacter valericigenes Sjm18-20]|nr:putative prohead protease [Oscillibacter valericigenes Sjm18-20]